ncbi:MAG TPA: FtsQ-type POTRA domain-containing protein [Clostridiales bacterium]|nr:FtsQ-type POTRA domain-containing protein [Clostridiales bacterium]
MNKKRVGILLFIAALMIAAVVIAIVSSVKPNKKTGGNENSLFAIKSILVNGSTHYTDQQIIDASGLKTGQSLIFVNKRKAAENILLSFPYIEKVTIRNASFNQLEISVEETLPAGVIQLESGWLIIGVNGKGLEILEDGSPQLQDYKVIKCETLENGGVGRITIDNRSREVINTILDYCKGTNLEKVGELDLKNFSDITLNWNNSIEIRLGSDVQLQEKLEFASSTLKRVLEDKGGDAEGRIDLRFYTKANQKAVFTPKELLTDGE